MFEELNEIIYTTNQVTLLEQWKDRHKELVRGYKPVLNEGLIKIVADTDDKSDFFQYVLKFSVHAEYTSLEYFIASDKQYELIMSFNFKKVDKLKTDVMVYDFKKSNAFDIIKQYVPIENKNDEEDYIKNSLLFMYCTTMAYMAFYEREYIIKEETPLRLTGSQKREIKRQMTQNPKSLISLNKKIYVLSENAKFKTPTKKEITRVTESWDVRGHPRRLKKGGYTWVKPYIKGKGRVKSKIYQVEI